MRKRMDMAFNYLCSVMMPPTHMPNCQVVMWDLFTNLKSKGLSVEWLSLLGISKVIGFQDSLLIQ